jgi:hypothetical protein
VTRRIPRRLLAAVPVLGVLALVTGSLANLARAHGIGGNSDNAVGMASPPQPDTTNQTELPKSLAPPLDRPAAAVLDGMRLWGVGQTLHICFTDPSPAEMRARIARIADEWTQYANLHFDFGSNPADPQMCAPGKEKSYDITISFRGATMSASYVGTLSRDHYPSMMLPGFDIPNQAGVSDRNYRRVVLHEFGHAIGLQHELQSPNANCYNEINWSTAEAFYKAKGWSDQDIKDNFQPMSNEYRTAQNALKATPFDKLSIMKYFIPSRFLKKGEASPCYSPQNYDLSPTDKQWVAALYKTPASQMQAKKAALARLDTLFRDGGVPDEERKAALKRIETKYMVMTQTINQQNTAGHDVNNVTIQSQGSGAVTSQSSSGANSPNIGTIQGGAVLNFGTISGGTVSNGSKP